MNITSETLRRLAVAGAVTGFLVFGAACSDDDDVVSPPPPPPPTEGTVTAQVVDDPADPPEEGYTGTLNAQAQVEVSTDGTDWVEVGTVQDLEVSLQTGDRATLHSEADLAEGTYTDVRLVMSAVQVDLDAGSTVGETTLEEDVSLSVAEGAEIIISTTLPTALQITAGAASTLVFDLNSEIWITEEAIQAEQVAAGEMEGNVEVDVEDDG